MGENKCSICEWNIRLHTHHIIPLKDNGKDTEKNKIVLCPNHHAEAHEIGHIKFNKKYSFVGEAYSRDELELKNQMAVFYFQICQSYSPKDFVRRNKRDVKKFLEAMKKYNWDRIDLFSSIMGVGRKEVRGICIGIHS